MSNEGTYRVLRVTVEVRVPANTHRRITTKRVEATTAKIIEAVETASRTALPEATELCWDRSYGSIWKQSHLPNTIDLTEEEELVSLDDLADPEDAGIFFAGDGNVYREADGSLVADEDIAGYFQTDLVVPRNQYGVPICV